MPHYRRWVPKTYSGRANTQRTTPVQQEDITAPVYEEGFATNAATSSSSTAPTVVKTQKARPTKPVKDANDDIGQCPAQQGISKPHLTSDPKSHRLMEVIFGTKLTNLVTATTKATKHSGTATKYHSTIKVTTKEVTSPKRQPTTQHANNRTASERPIITSTIQVPQRRDFGKFVINQFAHVSRESTYMEHMEPMVVFACRVHLWIIGVLCVLVLLLVVALFAKKSAELNSCSCLVPQNPRTLRPCRCRRRLPQ
ncbi:hypothetical protein MRX96_049542 [Rhipicephalus microplus]